MGDHRASIQIKMEFHGVKKSLNLDWINYVPSACGYLDERILDFFEEAYEAGMKRYNAKIAKQDKAEIEKQEREELARLQTKYGFSKGELE